LNTCKIKNTIKYAKRIFLERIKRDIEKLLGIAKVIQARLMTLVEAMSADGGVNRRVRIVSHITSCESICRL